MKMLRIFGPQRSIRVPHLAIGLGIVLGIYTLVFGTWTATSPWAFPRFVAATAVIMYFPGKVLVGAGRLRLGPLEDLTLSLVLGMTVATGLYWLCALVGVTSLFALWPLGATAYCVFRCARDWRRVRGYRFSLEAPHVLLAGLVVLSVVPLFALPMYYRNMALLPAGSMSYLNGPTDPFFHVSIANELAHSVPPQTPFLAGQSLSYHYWMHMLGAMLSNVAQLSTLDLIFRFLPTFFLVLAVLATFCFARIWMRHSYAALLATFLVIAGEDFSFIPGLLLHNHEVWSYWFFHVPTIYSCYFINPVLPGLAVLFAGLLCLVKFHEEGARKWLVVGAFLFAVLAEYKLFTSVHLFAALAIAGVIYLLLFRDRRLLEVLVLSALMTTPLLVYGLLGSDANLAAALRLKPWPFIPKMLRALGLGDTWLGFNMRLLFRGSVITLTNLALLFTIALPIYVVGSLGVGVAAIPSITKALLLVRKSEGVRFFLACFALLGPIISLTWSLTPETAPRAYNEASWFYVQSKHIIWLFVAELAFLICRGRKRFWQALVVTLLILLTVPSSIQYYRQHMLQDLAVLDRSGVEALNFLDSNCQRGEVALSGEELNILLAAATKCRVPVAELSRFYIGESELAERLMDSAGFWESWRRGELRAEVLERYQVAYVVADKRTDGVALGGYAVPRGEADSPGTQGSILRACFENERVVIYEVLWLGKDNM